MCRRHSGSDGPEHGTHLENGRDFTSGVEPECPSIGDLKKGAAPMTERTQETRSRANTARRWLAAANASGEGAISGVVVAAALLCGAAPEALAAVPSTPTVEGPITGPGPMHLGMRLGPEGT